MLKHMEISGYRGFKKFTMDGLSRVNLLVGKNNCGKTSLLECVEFLVSGGDPWNLVTLSERRGLHAQDHEDPLRVLRINISHFFNGYQILPGIKFTVQSDGEFTPIEVVIDSLDKLKGSSSQLDTIDESGPTTLGLQSIGSWFSENKWPKWAISGNHEMIMDHRWSPDYFSPNRRNDLPPIINVSPQSIVNESMSKMWNSVLQTRKEEFICDALRVLEPNLSDIAFQTNGSSAQAGSSSGILVGMKNVDRRLPLGSFGDGMRYLLGLAISLVEARGGYLLIDEIDTGLHYSIMADMWKLVIKTAVKENIQVFATTHSYDCIRGLAEVCDDEEMAGEVAVHKIHSDLEKSVLFPGSELPIVSQHDIEVR